MRNQPPHQSTRERLLSSVGSRYYTEHMSIEQIWRTDSTSLDETLRLGEIVGHKLRGGETIELVSDLGGGKTTFVRGLAHGMGSRDEVSSPSFTLSNQYTAENLILHHFDFYRLAEPGIMRDELAEALNDSIAVVVIEWADVVEDVLPEKRFTMKIKVTDKDSRRFEFSCPEELDYLLPKNT